MTFFFFNLLALSSQSVYVVSPLPPTTTMKRFLTIIPWIASHRLKHGRIDGIRPFQKPAVFEAYQGQQGLLKRGGKAFTTLNPPRKPLRPFLLPPDLCPPVCLELPGVFF